MATLDTALLIVYHAMIIGGAGHTDHISIKTVDANRMRNRGTAAQYFLLLVLVQFGSYLSHFFHLCRHVCTTENVAKTLILQIVLPCFGRQGSALSSIR